MDAKKLDNILILSRIAILELMVARITVSLRAARSPYSTSAAVQETLEEYEGFARGLEDAMYKLPQLQPLTDAERSLLADEYREMIDQMKGRVRDLFASST